MRDGESSTDSSRESSRVVGRGEGRAGQSAGSTALVPLRADDPRELAGYVLEARIGEGGMGTVYLSRTRGNQPVALKLIRREYADSAQFRQRFAREVEVSRQVHGYHIVPVVDHDSGNSPGSGGGTPPWLATRFVPGIALDDALDAHGPLPVPAVLQLLCCTARALDAIHTAGVIHRDVKPGNLLLASDGPWMLDFGIARAAGALTLTTVGRLVGTPKFMSPEHALGRRLTPATDVFALGLIGVLAATGHHPYGRGNGLAVAARIAGTDREPPDLSACPEPLRTVVGRCLAAPPEDRPSAAEVAEMCRTAVGRDVRDFSGWLPAPVAAAVRAREAAVRPASRTALAEAPTVTAPAPQAPRLPALAPTVPMTVKDPQAGEWSRRVRRTT
ncbi:serine/threonine-protein kinase [Streptomyces sp. NPDC048442]|uniref:serine/threonine-protein kinase n=1 Tax=Streptomyces sp. NPDC048442 TaxID=3154823 RepID=UPI00343D22B3